MPTEKPSSTTPIEETEPMAARRELTHQGENTFLHDMYRDTDRTRRQLWELPEIDVVDLLDEHDPRRVALLGNRTAEEVRGRLLDTLARADPHRRLTSPVEGDADFVECRMDDTED